MTLSLPDNKLDLENLDGGYVTYNGCSGSDASTAFGRGGGVDASKEEAARGVVTVASECLPTLRRDELATWLAPLSLALGLTLRLDAAVPASGNVWPVGTEVEPRAWLTVPDDAPPPLAQARALSSAWNESNFLVAGDRLLLYTDGFFEARSPAGEFFGAQGLAAVLAADSLDPAAMIEAVFGACEAFSGRVAPDDDQTAIALVIR